MLTLILSNLHNSNQLERSTARASASGQHAVLPKHVQDSDHPTTRRLAAIPATHAGGHREARIELRNNARHEIAVHHFASALPEARSALRIHRDDDALGANLPCSQTPPHGSTPALQRSLTSTSAFASEYSRSAELMPATDAKRAKHAASGRHFRPPGPDSSIASKDTLPRCSMENTACA